MKNFILSILVILFTCGNASQMSVKGMKISSMSTATSSGLTIGCGASNAPSTALDQTTCGNTIADGSAESYEPSYNDGAATVISTCGTTISAPGSYKLNADLNCTATAVQLTITPAISSSTSILFDLKGHTFTGLILGNDNNGPFSAGVHIFNGNILCNTATTNQGNCYDFEVTNGFSPVTIPFSIHHLTFLNSNTGSSSAFSLGGDFSATMTGALSTGGAYSDIIHHVTMSIAGGINVKGGQTNNRGSGGGVSGNNRTVHFYQNIIQNSDASTLHYNDGFACYETFNCDLHNNYLNPNDITGGDTPGRMLLLDGNAFGNGNSDLFNENANVYNNYCNCKASRILRERSGRRSKVHDNLVDNFYDPDPTANLGQGLGAFDWGDPTDLFGSRPPVSGTGTYVYDYISSEFYNNTVVFAKVQNQGLVAFRGNNAQNISFHNNTVSCLTNGCSGTNQNGSVVQATIQVKAGASAQFFNIQACHNTVTGGSLTTPIWGSGASQLSTSTINVSTGDPCTAVSGAVCNTTGASCP